MDTHQICIPACFDTYQIPFLKKKIQRKTLKTCTEHSVALDCRGFARQGGFHKGGFGGCSLDPQNRNAGTKKERRYENRNEGTNLEAQQRILFHNRAMLVAIVSQNYFVLVFMGYRTIIARDALQNGVSHRCACVRH